MKEKLTSKSIVVTGATSGIGFAAVKLFVQRGAFVIGVGRNENRNQEALQRIKAITPDSQVVYLLADLASQNQVRNLSLEIQDLLAANYFSHLDVLINNAGVYLEKKQISKDGIEMTFAVNHLAPFLLTNEMMPFLKRASQGKVITVSSYSHFTTPLYLNRITHPWPYIGLLAYKRSKLCNVIFTYEFNRRFDDVRAFAVDPGLVNTGIASKGSTGISHWVWRKRRYKGQSPESAAQTLLYLVSEDKIDAEKGWYFKDCVSKSPSRKAKQADIGSRLWDLSCDLTHINNISNFSANKELR